MARRLHKFELQRELRRGPHATTYRAHNLELDRPAIFKQFHGSTRQVKFARLDPLLQKLQHVAHPDIVPITRVLFDDDHCYLAREPAPGRRLDEGAGRGMASSEVVTLLRPVVKLLNEQHGLDLYHCHLTPHNLWVESGRVRLADFAQPLISRELAASVALTHSPFVAPELFELPEREPWPRAEVYTLARLLEFLLTGRWPTTGSPTELDSGRRAAFFELEEPARATPSRHRQLSTELDALLQRAQSPDPTQRPQELMEFWGDFVRVATSRPLRVTQVETSMAPAASSAPSSAQKSSPLRFCPRCRRATKPGATHCPQCGHAIAAAHAKAALAAKKPSPVKPPDKKADLFRSLGLSQLQQGNFVAAQQQLERALQRAPEDARTRMALARSLLAQREFDAGVAQFQLLTRSGDTRVVLAGRLGEAVAFALQSRYDEAVVLLEGVIEQNQRAAVASYVLGEIYLHRDDLLTTPEHVFSGERWFYRTLELDPDHAGAKSGLERCRQRRLYGQRPGTRLGNALLDIL